MAKVITVVEAVNMIHDDMTLMIGGFLARGTPERVVDQLVKKNVCNLTIIANDTARPEVGIGRLVVNKQIKKAIVSHVGTNPETGRQMNSGEISIELVPQGTLAERIRAGGFGLGGILTPTGVGTLVENGKQKIIIEEKEYLLELPLKADVALLSADKADKAGNLVYKHSDRNFNPLMAPSAAIVIAEVRQIVETGEIDPDEVMTPGIFVDYLVQG